MMACAGPGLWHCATRASRQIASGSDICANSDIACRCSAALVVGALLPAQAPAQNYPNHPITMIVPFAAGGLTDVPARVLAAMLQDRIGQTIVVENKPGVRALWAVPMRCGLRPTATRCSPIRSPMRRICISSPVPYNAIDDFAMIGMIVEGPPLS